MVVFDIVGSRSERLCRIRKISVVFVNSPAIRYDAASSWHGRSDAGLLHDFILIVQKYRMEGFKARVTVDLHGLRHFIDAVYRSSDKAHRSILQHLL